ncbi:hypothetical protein F5Y11DRAFT_214235 [Daldinia sp. FL1419]|nr:hypothetical protein F5Y11DRAFT_214235 [Daldinia sp. FL1419]
MTGKISQHKISAWSTPHGIMDIVYGYIISSSEGEILPENVEKKFEKVPRRLFRKFVHSNVHTCYFFRAFMCNFLCAEIFDNPFKLWCISDGLGSGLGRFYSGEVGGDNILTARDHIRHKWFTTAQ